MTQAQAQQRPTHDLPLWLTGLVLLLCVSGGTWLIMKLLKDQPSRHVEIPLDKLNGSAHAASLPRAPGGGSGSGRTGSWRGGQGGPGGGNNFRNGRPTFAPPINELIQSSGRNSWRLRSTTAN